MYFRKLPGLIRIPNKKFFEEKRRKAGLNE